MWILGDDAEEIAALEGLHLERISEDHKGGGRGERGVWVADRESAAWMLGALCGEQAFRACYTDECDVRDWEPFGGDWECLETHLGDEISDDERDAFVDGYRERVERLDEEMGG